MNQNALFGLPPITPTDCRNVKNVCTQHYHE